MKRNINCRVCGSQSLTKVLDLSRTALANSFLEEKQFDQEQTYPLEVFFCNNCFLLQLIDVVSPETLFSSYAYFTGASSKTLPEHFIALAKDLARQPQNKFIVEIGSNDGVLLRTLKDSGIDILGVEPAMNIAQAANELGLETINEFFSENVAHQIVEERGKADVVIANNVVAHIDNLAGLVRGVHILLKEEGRFIIEVHHVGDLIENKGFDQIYHEHLSYFSLTVLQKLFLQFGMNVFDVNIIPIHGRSLRVHVGNKNIFSTPTKLVKELIKEEERLQLNNIETYFRFASDVELIKMQLLSILRDLKANKKRIIGYGAPAKGNTLLNFCGIGPDILDYVTDTTPAKQNLFTPGTHIPIYSPEKLNSLKEEGIDYMLLLAWNYADEIFRKEEDLRKQGIKFIVPIPIPKIAS